MGFNMCPAAQGKCDSAATIPSLLDIGSLILSQPKCRSLHEGWASHPNDATKMDVDTPKDYLNQR